MNLSLLPLPPNRIENDDLARLLNDALCSDGSGVDSCSGCGSIYFSVDYSGAERVCSDCGMVDSDFYVLLPELDHYSSAASLFKRKAAYQRSYHFNERVAQYTCRGPKAPMFVVLGVLREVSHRNIRNPYRVDSGFIKRVCTQLGAAKYAER